MLVGVFLEAEGDVSDIRARPKVNDQTNGERERECVGAFLF